MCLSVSVSMLVLVLVLMPLSFAFFHQLTLSLSHIPINSLTGMTSNNVTNFVLNSNKKYYCAQCTNGPFQSSEELGQHVAMCYTVATLEKRKALMLKKKTNLNELVSNLQNVISSTLGTTTVTTATSGSGGDSSDNAVAGGGKANMEPKKKGGKTLKGSKDKSKAINFDAPEGPQNLDEGNSDDAGSDSDATKENHDNDGNDSDAISWDSDDEISNDMIGTDNNKNSAISNDDINSTLNKQPIMNAEDNLIVKQYQSIFDDTQVDLDLILALLRYVFKTEYIIDGSVLIFMPGWDDISRMAKILNSEPDFCERLNNGNKKYKVIQLHR